MSATVLLLPSTPDNGSGATTKTTTATGNRTKAEILCSTSEEPLDERALVSLLGQNHRTVHVIDNLLCG